MEQPQKLVVDLETQEEQYVPLEGEELAEYESRQREPVEAFVEVKPLSELVREAAAEVKPTDKPKDVLQRLADKLEGR